MTSKLKALVLALLAFAAIGALGASAAYAGVGELHVTGTNDEPADITSPFNENHVFTLPGILFGTNVEVKCAKVGLEGTIQDQGSVGDNQTTAKEATITGLYTECETALGAAQVRMNGCKYTVTGGSKELTANLDITGCTTGTAIEVISAGCVVTIPEQSGVEKSGLGHITFKNEGKAKSEEEDVTGNITVAGIQYTIENAGGCIIAPQQHSDATYKGASTLQAFRDTKETKLVTHEGHQFKQLVCGAQKGLFAT
jgi:hypothetical protein